jgi:hypothetical protein
MNTKQIYDSYCLLGVKNETSKSEKKSLSIVSDMLTLKSLSFVKSKLLIWSLPLFHVSLKKKAALNCH